MLADLVLVLDWASHIERDVDRADLVEEGKVLTYLLPQLVF